MTFSPYLDMAVVSRFRNPLASRRGVEMSMLTLNRICYSYLHNDWAAMLSATVTFFYTAASLIGPDDTQAGSNP